jgi:predicted RNA-binding protein Jag
MGKYFDFCVRYDPTTDSPQDLTNRILYSLIIKRLKAKKPVVIFMSGDSGEGKSYSALRFMQLILELQGLNIRDFMDDINVFTPLEYSQKLDRLLFDDKLKKVNVICMHEAREIVKAKQWHTFLNQAVADVNAMSRTIKRICFIIVSQFIRDISNDMRYTLNFYVNVYRPIGQKAQLSINVMWKDDRDLEKPKLRKRKIRGYIVDNKGRYRIFQPQYLEMTKPTKDIRELFDKKDFDAKTSIIRRKMEKLINEMKVEMEFENRKVEAMVNWYIDHQEDLNVIGKRIRGKWKVNPQVKVMHNLTDQETKDFEAKLTDKMKERGMV